MKNIISFATVLLISMNVLKAQGTLETAENSISKSQQQVMDDYNSKTNVGFKFYPNPAVNYLIVEPELRSDVGILKILDITGRVITFLRLEGGSNGATIDLTQYHPGLYVLAYYDENNKLLHVDRFYKN